MTGAVIIMMLGFAVFAKAAIPSGYILQINPSCGTDGIMDGSISMITDLNAQAKVICKDGVEVNFTTTDHVNFRVNYSYPDGSGSEPCVFEKRANSSVFVSRVWVSYGEPGSVVHQSTEEFTVTCTFDPNGDDGSDIHTVDETLIAAKDLERYQNGTSPSTVALKMSDVLGGDLAGLNVGLGRTVQLTATLTGPETCIRPVSCDALDSTNARYSILRAGCGDGIVFMKDKGFTTTGKTAVSPYFKLFSVNVDESLMFECNVTVSATACDGSSCETASRKKRGAVGRVIPLRSVVNAGTKAVKLLGVGTRGGIAQVHRVPKI